VLRATLANRQQGFKCCQQLRELERTRVPGTDNVAQLLL
jgi:hypothetical protein